MALRAAAAATLAAIPKGQSCNIRRLFSTTSSTPSFFNLPSSNATARQDQQPPKADPNPNLFVSGLSKRTTTEGLRDAFAKFGEVVHAKVVTDRVSGYSKGYGFVRYATTEEAAKGIEGMDGKFLDGWVIFAEYARPRAPLGPMNYSNSTPYGHQ